MKSIMLFIMGVLLLSTLPALAQDTRFSQEEQADIRVVSEAVAHVKAADSYSVRTEQNISQQMETTIGKDTYTFSTTLVQNVFSRVENTVNGYNIAATINQDVVSELSGQRTTIEVSMKVVVVDGTMYIYVIDGGSLGAGIPDGWFNLSEEPTVQANSYFASFSAETVNQLNNLDIPFDENSVDSIERLPDVELDGHTMRVFEVSYNPQAVIESGVMGTLSQSFGAQFSEGDAEQLLEDIFAAAQIHYTFYVGEDDDLLYQLDSTISVDTTLTIEDLSLPLVMHIESVSAFGDFNAPSSINAPVVE